MKEENGANPFDCTKVTERVDARLVQGGYQDYAQLAREESTTEGFVAKRAHHLKQQGTLSGDRRSLRAKEQTMNPGTNNASQPIDPRVHEQRMQAYRMIGVPEEDLKIMEAGHLNSPQELIMMRREARELRHDKLTEQVSKEFRDVAELTDFIKFYRTARIDGVKSSQYNNVMASVSESSTLEERLEEQKAEIENNNSIIKAQSRIIAQNDEKRKENAVLNNDNCDLKSQKEKLELYFKEVAEGKITSPEINQITRQVCDRFLEVDFRWALIFDAFYNAIAAHPQEFIDFSLALRAGNREYVYANGSRLGVVIVEAEGYIRRNLANRAAKAAQREIAESFRRGKTF